MTSNGHSKSLEKNVRLIEISLVAFFWRKAPIPIWVVIQRFPQKGRERCMASNKAAAKEIRIRPRWLNWMYITKARAEEIKQCWSDTRNIISTKTPKIKLKYKKRER